MTRTTTRRRLAALLLCGTLAAVLAACGDDGDEDDVASGSTDATVESDDDGGGGDDGGGEADLATYCEKTVEIETVGEPDVDFETATPEEILTASKEFALEKMVDPAQEIQEVAPAEIAEDIDLLVAAVDELAETGDFEAAFDEEVQAASARAHAFDLDNCDWSVAEVTTRDYAFEGVRSSYPAGVTSFEVSNEGEEMHELIVLRKKDDTTESFEELLELPQAEAESKVDTVASTFLAPGEEGAYAMADLEEGEYIVLCFLPVGFTPEVAEAAESGGAPPEGPPHFTQGMRAEFTVE